MRTVILLTFENNILLQSFNWPKPVHYIPTDKINASIRIRIGIRRILVMSNCKALAFQKCNQVI